MKGKSRVGLVLILLGAVMLIGALALYQNNQEEALEAEAASGEVMEQMAVIIAGRNTQPDPDDVVSAAEPAEEKTQIQELPSWEPSPEEVPVETVEIDGNRYIGFLTIPALSLELPVMENWDYDLLKIAPCRYSGTLKDGDLVIAAHNYKRHFGRLSELSVGSEVLFTDAAGSSTKFTVAELEILQPEDVEYMTAGEYELTLFTCTYGGSTRFAARCVRAD